MLFRQVCTFFNRVWILPQVDQLTYLSVDHSLSVTVCSLKQLDPTDTGKIKKEVSYKS